MEAPRVSIIILNWNGWRDTIECLESVYRVTYPNYDVIIVDNGSQDDSVQRIKEYAEGKIRVDSKFFEYNPENKPIKVFEVSEDDAREGRFNRSLYEKYDVDRRMILIKNRNNYGFAGGNNVGIKFALSVLNPDYVLLLNNDVTVTKSILEDLIKEAIKKQYIISQPKIVHYEDMTLSSTGGYMDVFGGVLLRGCCEKDLDKYDTEDIKDQFFYVDGACMLVDRRLISELRGKLFDEKLFLYGEDVDISWQCRLRGLRIGYTPKGVCYHKRGASAGRRNVRNVYLGFRNRIRILLKNYNILSVIVFLPLAILFRIGVIFVIAILERNFEYLKVIVSALKWNVENILDTARQRQRIQKARKIDDTAIIRYMSKIPLEIVQLLMNEGDDNDKY